MRKYNIAMFAAGILIVLGIIFYADPLKLAGIMATADVGLLFLAILLSTVSLLLRVLKWSMLVGVGFFELMPIQMLGITISNFTPGKVAEPIKAVLLKMKTNKPVSETLPSIFWERILDITVLLLLSAITMNMFAGLFVFFVAGAGMFAAFVVLLILLVCSKGFGMKFFSLAKKLPILKRISPDFVNSFYKTKIGNSRIAGAFAVTFVPWVLDGIVLFLVLLSLGTNAPLLLMPGVVALSVILGVASSLPGGLGTTEIVMSMVLINFGIGSSVAIAAVLISRLMSFWYGTFFGSLSFIYLSKRIGMKNIF